MKLTRLALLIFFFSNIETSVAEELALKFNPDFLIFSDGKKASSTDLSYLAHADGILPGSYTVSIVVNGKNLGQEDITFYQDQASGRVRAKLTPELLERWGVSLSDIEGDHIKILNNGGLEALLPGAQDRFEKTRQVLSLDIPQRWLDRPRWLKTSPQSWDDGLSSLLMNYRYSGAQQRVSGRSKSNDTLSLSGGFNIGGWRIRHDGFWGHSSSTEGYNGWQSVNTWASHDYSFGQGGQFRLGQISSDDSIFESFPFEGAQLSSDDGMIVPWLSSFSPVIRGVANSQSQIIVRQNNMIIWQGTVSAGSFELRDVAPLYAGNMDIEIHEADGSIRRFSQNSATVPVLQREGRLRYSFSLGRYRHSTEQEEGEQVAFIQSTAAWGMGADFTLYGGLIWADNYRSAMIGAGKYMENVGAFSADVAHAISELPSSLKNNDDRGQALRFMFARGFDSTDTHLSIAGYWYNSSGYYSFNDLQQQLKDSLSRGYYDTWKAHSKISSQIAQDVSNIGQLNLSADWTRYRYWEENGWQTRLSWSFPVGKVSTSLSIGYSKQPQYNDSDKLFYLSVNVPFNTFYNYDNASLNSSVLGNNSDTVIRTGVNGTLLDQRLAYSVMEGRKNHRNGSVRALNARYRGTYGEIQSAWSHEKNNQQWMYGVSGGVALHGGGITLAQELNLNGANALIDTNRVGGIKVNNGTGVSTDWRGYTIISNLVPYQENDLSLDVNSSNDNAEIISTDLTVTPSRGALVPARFNVVSGNKALITLTRPDGSPIPFGSIVSVLSTDGSSTQRSNIVADNGQVWMSGLNNKGILIARWGADGKTTCQALIPEVKVSSGFSRLSLVCK
ncbi:fimbria/pilus outer membrane usher protein [Yersinia enterocolitica]|uniref:fimbria/pilus outer membrane usher protein n=1 Tax=Yersinia enterocolitica TaxID=630 RepID=UPI003AB4C997